MAKIIAALRSAVVPRAGAFSHLSLHELAAPVVQNVVRAAGICTDQVDELIVSNALGAGGNPARVCALAAGLPVGVAGLSTATFGSVGPLFASAVGLSVSQIALFLVVSIIGGIVSQLPSGMLADRLPRRVVLMAFSIMATIVSLLMATDLVYLELTGIPVVFILSFLFGLTTFPIYSICAAHASDFVRQSEMLALSASLIFIYAAGAIISPLIAGLLIDRIAAWAMFILISAAHFLLMLYTVYRNFVGRASLVSRAYAYVPRTSLFIATIIRSRLGRAAPAAPPDHQTQNSDGAEN